MKKSSSGFTLVEVVAAITIFVAATALALAGYTFLLKNANQGDVQDELNNDAQKAIERLKMDMRLSSMNQIFYYPEGNPPYTAVSFPIAYDSDGDGMIERDSAGMIIWDDTVIYHIRTGSPDELVRTVLKSRNNSLSDDQRQAQLNTVVKNGNADAAAASGESGSSHVIFRNLLNWSLSPSIGSFVCYAPTPSREAINLGFVLLDSGSHEFKFTVENRAKASNDDLIGVDTLTISPSYIAREAEVYLPTSKSDGATPVKKYNSSYSGESLLFFDGENGDSFTLTMDNDRWEDTNFGGRYSSQSNTVVKTHYDSVTPPIAADNVIELDGNKLVWEAEAQCGDYTGGTLTNLLAGSVVRVMMKGSSLSSSGSYITGTGAKTRFTFAASPSSALRIENVVFGASISSNTMSMAYDSSTMQKIEFNNGGSYDNSTSIAVGGKKTSEWLDVSLDPAKNYIVSYSIYSGAPMAWTDVNGTNSTQIATLYTGDAEGMATTPYNWKNLTPTPIVVEPKVLLGLESAFVSYVKKGTYTSEIIDTTIDSPNYGHFIWNSNIPGNAKLSFKVRSGNNPALTDATSFDAMSATIAPLESSKFSPSLSGRYVQYQAVLESSDDGLLTPRLRNTAITWTGERRMMEISGIFSKGPNYGNFSLSVDGKGLQSALMVDLEIYKDVMGMKNKTRRISSEVKVALTPRNSGL